MLPSLHHNEIIWNCTRLGETVLLLEPQVEKDVLAHVHGFSASLREAGIIGIVDVVTAYNSMAIIFETTKWDHETLIKVLKSIPVHAADYGAQTVHEILVDYNAGLDWKAVTEHTGLSKREIIERHTQPEYTVAMIGFLPGFIFLDGLDPALATPRLATPRTKIPAGSVGIGGHQTGLYSLESPGGWNIIGRTETRFFNIEANPPINLLAGDKVRFINKNGGN